MQRAGDLGPDTGKRLRRVCLLALIALWAALLIIPTSHVASAAGAPPHILVVLMENTSYEGVVGNSAMPFVNGLVASNGSVSTTDLSHPSLPNYLGLISGSIQNNPQDTTPQDGTYPGTQLTDELSAAGIGWKAYMQDMPQPCDLTDQYGPGLYDVNHNPFMYFNTVRTVPAQCNRDVPYPQLAADLNAGAAPSFLWVSPNTLNDMHDGSPAQGDAFLQGLVTQVRGSSWWTASSRIVITWDEGTQSDQVLTLVVGSAHGTPATGGSEYGTLRGLEEAYGVGLLGGSAGASSGDILPLLAGSTSPPPAPPSPSPSPTPPAAASPTHPPASPVASAGQSGSPVPSATSPPIASGPPPFVRGAYGKDSSAPGTAMLAATGFNTVMADPYKESLDPLTAQGLKGVVWLGAWMSAPACKFERDDATIRSQIAPIAGHPAILAYYLGDEPRVTECPSAPAMFKQRSDLVHSLDPGSTTFTVIQAYENGITYDYKPWAGVVDVVGLDVYPCAKAKPTCDLAAIDGAVAAAQKAGIGRYWAIVQDFQDCFYRLPAPSEIAAQFDRWAASDMAGYLVFSWNYQPADKSCIGTNLESHPENVAQLKSENSRTFAPPAASSPAPSPRRPLLTANQVMFAGAAAAALLALIALGAIAVMRRRRETSARQAVEQLPVPAREVDVVSGGGDVDKPD